MTTSLYRRVRREQIAWRVRYVTRSLREPNPWVFFSAGAGVATLISTIALAVS